VATAARRLAAEASAKAGSFVVRVDAALLRVAGDIRRAHHPGDAPSSGDAWRGLTLHPTSTPINVLGNLKIFLTDMGGPIRDFFGGKYPCGGGHSMGSRVDEIEGGLRRPTD
jgi:hypothetical protein